MKNSLKYVLIISGILGATVIPAIFRADTQVRFFHKPHLDFALKKNIPLDCDDCHQSQATTGEFKLDEKFCDRCHDLYGVPKYRLAHPGRKLDQIHFDHKAHTKDIKCNECHELTAADKAVASAPLMAPDICLDCHKKKDNKKRISKRSCNRCHKLAKKTIPPENHQRTWDLSHGREAEWNKTAGHGKECTDCHHSSLCVTCHREQKPRDHNALWRLRTHGVEANWERERCKTCHENGACMACHRSTEPLSHNGAWRATHGLTARMRDNNRCTTCHSPGWCADCHRGVGR